MRTLTYFIATSVDGFIADPAGGLDHMVVSPELVAYLAAEYPETLPTPAREAMGVTAPNRSFDTVIQGRRTYQLGLDAGVTSPYGHLRQYVASRGLTSPDPAVTVVADPLAAVRALKAEQGLGIYLAGGGELAGLLLPEIDEIVVKVYPVVAGAGVPLFGGGFRPRPLRLRESRVLDCGTAVLRYVPA